MTPRRALEDLRFMLVYFFTGNKLVSDKIHISRSAHSVTGSVTATAFRISLISCTSPLHDCVHRKNSHSRGGAPKNKTARNRSTSRTVKASKPSQCTTHFSCHFSQSMLPTFYSLPCLSGVQRHFSLQRLSTASLYRDSGLCKEKCLYLHKEKCLFTGARVSVKREVPLYIKRSASLQGLESL